MNTQEELTRLRMRVAELEKENRKNAALIHKLTEENDTLCEDNEVLTRAIRSGKEKLRLELFLRFGSSSEKYRKLFNIPVELLNKNEEALSPEEQKTLAEVQTAIDEFKSTSATTDKKERRNRNPAHRTRGNGCGRQSFDPSYPREQHDFTLGETCSTCGCKLVPINASDIHEHIDILKENLRIIKQIRHKGYCSGCGEKTTGDGTKKRTIITAPAPQRFIPGGLAGDALIATSLVDKFFYGLSVTRIAKRFQNLGVDLSEQNFANWHIRAGSELKPVAEAIKRFILSQEAVNADETKLQVLDEEERADELKSWLWVMCSATPGKPAAYFQYDVSRSSDVFKEMVGDYAGFLQSDACNVYLTEKQEYKFTHALCLAHLRRRFIDAQKAGNYPQDSVGYITLDRIITTIGKIYKIDKTYRAQWLDEQKMSEQQFIKIRKEESLPLFKKLSKWITGRYDFHGYDEYIMEGMKYYLNNEMLFRSYLDCANLNPDNSRVERVIRAFSIIRANALFAGCPDGAHAFATLESVIQTANLWDLDLYGYVTYLLKELTNIRALPASSIDYTQFLPWNLTPELRQEMAVQTISIKKKPD